MKTQKMIALALTLTASFAAQAGAMNCQGETQKDASQPFTLTLTGDLREESISTVSATVKTDEETVVGRAAYLERDAKYQPRKYKDSMRFQLSKLTETNDFGSFLPADSCAIDVIIPNKASTQTKFQVPVLVHCDQSGGVFTMSCTNTPDSN